MRRFCFGLVLLALTAAVRADEAADRPYLVLQTNGHTAPIWKILYTSDGNRVLTISEDKTIRVWDSHTGERLGVLRPPVGPGMQGELRAGALSPDGKTLAVGGLGYEGDGKHVSPIYLLNLAGGRITAVLQDERVDVVLCLAFSPDGKRLASGGNKGLALLWDVGAGKCLYALEEPQGAVSLDEKYPPDIRDIAFSPNGKLLATACNDKTAWIWSAETGRKAAGPLQHEGPVHCVAWKDDDALATAGAEIIGIRLWDREGKALRSYDKPRLKPSVIHALAFLPGKNKTELLFYLLPSDVNVSDLPGTGVTGTQIKEDLQAVPGRVLVLLDACHSGSIGQSPADPASLTDDVQRQRAAPDCGVVILCAAMAQEEAGEAAAVQHGFFTAALLKGLAGAAPSDRKDGLIHLTGLNYYVEQEVAELSKDEQHVVVDRPATVTSFPLVKPGGKPE